MSSSTRDLQPISNGETSVTPPPEQDPKAVAERAEKTVTRPGGFKNDPDDSTNPNEQIERHREKLRP